MVHDSVLSCIGATPMVALRRLFAGADVEVLAKLEFMNPAGSVKDRVARHIVEHGLRTGMITPDSRLVESTSGNLGVALALVARLYDLSFTAVVDPKTAPANLAIMRNYGVDLDMVDQPDDSGGYLKTRLERVQQILAEDPTSVWINQYANELNADAHYVGTGAEILDAVGDERIDCLVAAVSTTGTVVGTARRLRERFPDLLVVAVDAVGSVIFGGPPADRRLPGIGSSRRPELLDIAEIDRVVHVAEDDALCGCRDLLATEAIFAGGSSGSVIAGVRTLLPIAPPGARIVTILPDRGERYLGIVYPDSIELEPRDMALDLAVGGRF